MFWNLWKQFFQTPLVPGESSTFLPQKPQNTFLCGCLGGGEEEGGCVQVGAGVGRSAPPGGLVPRLRGGRRGLRGIPGAALCVSVVFLEQVAISCSVAMHVSRRRVTRRQTCPALSSTEDQQPRGTNVSRLSVLASFSLLLIVVRAQVPVELFRIQNIVFFF